jgi:hypothetical protein
MTRDDIIRMGKEAGWSQLDIDSLLYIVETAAAAEREACAKVCDARCIADGWEGFYADECAAAIRARGQE